MREMKDSGIEWIGQIPKEWKIIRLKNILREPMKYGANEAGVEYSSELPRYIRITDITLDGKLKNSGKLSLPDNIANEYILKDKAILFARSGATVGKTFMYKREYGRMAFAGYLISAYCNEKLLYPKFLYYFTNSCAYFEWINRVFSQSTIQNIGADKYVNMILAIPEITEQKKIIAYLDTQCAEIDATAKDIQKEISLLEDYKKSVITEAVTKGLNPDAEMKDSGIEWIGEIPKEWKILRFDYLLHERSEKNSPVITDERLALSIDKGITLYSEKTTNLDRFKEDVSQYKIAYVGDFVMNSMNMIVGAVDVSSYFGCVSPAYYVFYDDNSEHYICRFCNYVFHTPVLKKVLYSLGKGIMAIDRGDGKVNTCRLKVSRYDLAKLKIPVPTNKEIIKIVDYLDTQCSEIDALIADKKKQLEVLAEYKKSLIYEYVTGKKEVPAEK